MYREIGAGDAVFVVSGPPPQDWSSVVPWAAGRRRQVMERVADALVEESPDLIPSFGDDYTTVILSRPPASPRDVGHWLLLVLSVVFFGEQFVFFTAALHNPFAARSTALYFLILTIGVFLTAVAALYGFARRIRASFSLFVGLLGLQPGGSYLPSSFGRLKYPRSSPRSVPSSASP
jgi:hypothetical protein